MTIREIASIAGCTPQTVRETVRRIYPDLMEKKRKTVLDYEQSKMVIGSLRIEHKRFNKISNLKENLPESLAVGDIKSIISQTVAETIRQILPIIQGAQAQKPLQIEARFITARAYCVQKGLPSDTDYVMDIAHRAKKYSYKNGMPIQKIPDDRFGFINTYMREALDAVV